MDRDAWMHEVETDDECVGCGSKVVLLLEMSSTIAYVQCDCGRAAALCGEAAPAAA